MTELSDHLLITLAQVFSDPGQTKFWAQDGNGLDHVLLGVISGLLPPEACDLPRNYEGERRRILAGLEELEAQGFIRAAPGKSILEAIRPTPDGLAYVSASTRPWWRKLWDRLSER